MSVEHELSKFLLGVWPGRCGDEGTLGSWIRRAEMAFPDVNLIEEARRAALWEAERPSNSKKSIRRFLRNWWARSQESARPVAPVVSLSAVRWLSKHNKSPDYAFQSWARGRDISESCVLAFCSYIGADFPDDASEVVSILRGGN